MECHTLVCTTKHEYAPQFSKVQTLLHLNKVLSNSMSQYAPQSYEMDIRALKYTNSCIFQAAQYRNYKTLRHCCVRNTMKCHILKCTGMHQYAPQIFEVKTLLNVDKIVCTEMPRIVTKCLASVKIHKFLNTGYKNDNCISKTFHVRGILKHCGICQAVQYINY